MVDSQQLKPEHITSLSTFESLLQSDLHPKTFGKIPAIVATLSQPTEMNVLSEAEKLKGLSEMFVTLISRELIKLRINDWDLDLNHWNKRIVPI